MSQPLAKSKLNVDIIVVGPLLTRSVEARHFSEDQLGLLVNDRPALPGTLVKGVFRAAMEEMLDLLSGDEETQHRLSESVEKWFGPAVRSRDSDDGVEYGGATTISGQQESWEPVRGALNFSGYWLADATDHDSASLTRIRIDGEKGVVEPGALVVARSPIQPGQRAVFRGSIECWLPTDEAREARKWLSKASVLIDAVGGATTVGFGTVDSISVREPEVQECAITVPEGTISQTSGQPAFGLRLLPDRPFCFAKPHGRSNVLESESFIPGGAIIGAIAEALQNQPGDGLELLRKNLHAIHVTHALPAVSGAPNKNLQTRSTSLPMSLACVAGQVVDFSEESRSDAESPAFAADWKSPHEKLVLKALGLEQELVQGQQEEQGSGQDQNRGPRHVSIVRNQIEPTSGAAAEAALFALDAIDPAGHEWRSNVTIDTGALSNGEDPHAVLAQFRAVLELGLVGLGKTKARAEIKIFDQPWSRQFEDGQDDALGKKVQAGATIRLLLASNADLLGPVESLPGAGGASILGQLYQAYFDLLLGKDRLSLDDWFTQEALAGGRYIYRRYWDSGREDYRPHLMTAAGSLFVLTVNSSLKMEETEALSTGLDRIRKLGLPPGPLLAERDSERGQKETAWQRHPWLNSQGYGEVIIDPVIGINNQKEKSDVPA